VVAAEILVLPLAFGMWGYALVFTALNAAVLFIRIKAEGAALRNGLSLPSAGGKRLDAEQRAEGGLRR
jgi:methyltransferase